MSINVKTFFYDDIVFSSNAYIVYDDNSAFIIDPGINDEKLIDFIKDNNLTLKGILLTHGHFDHMRGLELIKELYPSIPIYIHKADKDSFKSYRLNASTMDEKLFMIDIEGTLVDEEDIIKGLEEDIYIIHTPFHTLGSVCFYLKDSKLLFSGDTLFNQSIGRFDLINSDFHLIKPSLKKITSLDDDIKIFPGHGPITISGYEKKYNPYLK